MREVPRCAFGGDSLLRVSTHPLPTNLIRERVDYWDEIVIVEEAGPLVDTRLNGLFGLPGKLIRRRLDGFLPVVGELFLRRQLTTRRRVRKPAHLCAAETISIRKGHTALAPHESAAVTQSSNVDWGPELFAIEIGRPEAA